MHVAIDRFTGQVIDKQIEVANEQAASQQTIGRLTTDSHAPAAFPGVLGFEFLYVIHV